MSRARNARRKQWKKDNRQAKIQAMSKETYEAYQEQHYNFIDGMDAAVLGIPKELVTAQRILENAKRAREASRIETIVEATELVAELVVDALKASGLFSKSLEYNMNPYEVSYPEPFWKGGGFEFRIKNDYCISISHYPEVEVDDTADLITDADKVEALIEWIYEGGQFPLLKGEK